MEDKEECKFVNIHPRLQVCWGKHNDRKCLLGEGAGGFVCRGKWKVDPEASESIDVAVKVPKELCLVVYEIATLKKVNGHPHNLEFYDEIQWELGPVK